jgi:hypothetical protein
VGLVRFTRDGTCLSCATLADERKPAENDNFTLVAAGNITTSSLRRRVKTEVSNSLLSAQRSKLVAQDPAFRNSPMNEPPQELDAAAKAKREKIKMILFVCIGFSVLLFCLIFWGFVESMKSMDELQSEPNSSQSQKQPQ